MMTVPRFLEILGLGETYANLAEEFELEDLKSLEETDRMSCLSELEKAGVSLGHRAKIVRALRHGIRDMKPASSGVVSPLHQGSSSADNGDEPEFPPPTTDPGQPKSNRSSIQQTKNKSKESKDNGAVLAEMPPAEPAEFSPHMDNL